MGLPDTTDLGYMVGTGKDLLTMEDTKNTEEVKNNVESESGDGAVENTDTTNTEDNAEETVTMSKVDYDRAIQSAEDKVRGKLSKQIRDLEAKVKELTPVEKTQAEIDLENRIAALEASEKAVADREKKVATQEQLSAKGLDKALVDYIKDDADIDALSNIVNELVKSKMKSNGYVPSEHSSDEKITPEEFAKMTYSQKAELSVKHPETYKRLMGRK